MAENMMQTPTGKFSRQWPEPQRFPQFLDKMGKLMSEDYDWSADIAKLPMPVLLVFADNDSVPQKHDRGVLCPVGRRREGARLAQHPAFEVPAGGRSWLQPLQLHKRTGSAADCHQVPGRSAQQSIGWCSGRLSDRAARKETIAPRS